MSEKRVPWNEEKEKAIADELARIDRNLTETFDVIHKAERRIQELQAGIRLLENTHPRVIAALREEGRI